MWLHKENKHEWYYIGIWADRIENEETLATVKKLCGENCNIGQLFLPFQKYSSPVELLSENLKVRNEINRLKAHGKEEAVKEITDSVEAKINGLQNALQCIFNNETGIFYDFTILQSHNS